MTITQQWQPPALYTDRIDVVHTALLDDIHAGLTTDIADARLQADGQNSLGASQKVEPLRILLDQFRSSVIVLLLIAAAISASLGEYLQTIGIIVAVFINAAIGFITEYQAKISLEKLARLSGSLARVKRDGVEKVVPVAQLVKGDILLLQPGDRVPADARLVESAALSVDESILTGESVPVWKGQGSGDDFEKSVLYQGTMIGSGRAKAIVVGTGMHTRLGSLACTIDSIDTAETPLQTDLNNLGYSLTWLTVGICIFVGLAGLFIAKLELMHLLQTAIALAVAAIPEGLPVVSTLALAIGIQRMVKKRALVRRLTAVETLGCTTIICTDKTGTLTENKMMVTRVVTARGISEFGGAGYIPSGSVINVDSEPACEEDLQRTMIAAAMCNDATLQQSDKGWSVVGDPTEGALVVAARKVGLSEHELALDYARICELPFDLDRKRMSTLHAQPGRVEVVLFCKGSPESVLKMCSTFRSQGRVEPLTAAMRARFELQNKGLAAEGLRVLAVAERDFNERTICIDQQSLERDMTLLGLVAMADNLRPGVKRAIADCKAAGIKILMITGDQPITAQAIGRQLGIEESEVLARVTPEMKLSVVQKLQSQGEVVAMTGDGVNDAPALKQADIGVAMGFSGSDLARDAASLVIVDDNFATIVAAVEEGRTIYRNIKRAVAYLLTASIASLLVIAMGVFVSRDVLLTPLQLLWLNLIMHVFPAFGLVLQRDTSNSMSIPPRRRTEHLLTRKTIQHIGLRALVVGAIAVLAPLAEFKLYNSFGGASMVLAVLSLGLILQSWSWLFDTSIDQYGIKFSPKVLFNVPMILNSAIGVGLLVLALYNPVLQPVLETKALNLSELMFACAAAGLAFFLSIVFAFVGKLRRPDLKSRAVAYTGREEKEANACRNSW